MHFLTLGLIVLLWTLPRPAWSQQAPCDAFPAGSISRLECERTQQRLDKEQGERKEKEGWSTLPPGTLTGGYRSVTPRELRVNAIDIIAGRQRVIVRGLLLRVDSGGGRASFEAPGMDLSPLWLVGIPDWVPLYPRGNDFILMGLEWRKDRMFGKDIAVPTFLYLGRP
jgi:hypothetical protein